MQERQHSSRNFIEGVTSVWVHLGTQNVKMNPKKAGLVNGWQVRKSKVCDEYTISHGSGISYMVFTSGYMLSTCTHVEYIFWQWTFILSFVFHMFFISKLCYSPLAVWIHLMLHFLVHLVFTLMASICDISTKLICYNNPINRKPLHRLRYCWINLFNICCSKYYVVFIHTSVLWKMKKEDRDTNKCQYCIPENLYWSFLNCRITILLCNVQINPMKFKRSTWTYTLPLWHELELAESSKKWDN